MMARYVARIFFVCAFAYAAPAAAASDIGLTTESSLRSLASRIVKPLYPPDDIRARRTGVAVAELDVDQHGRIARVTILEAPSTAIADAMTAALKQWEFGALAAAPRASGLRSRITFYFIVRNGVGLVQNPAEAGYLGRWPEPR
jgi:hypothetical protein